jgi:large subunit ribosomal protein L30
MARGTADRAGAAGGPGGASPPDGFTITQVRSSNGSNKKQRETLRTLGLGRIGATSQKPDEPSVRGAIAAVSHLVEVRS